MTNSTRQRIQKNIRKYRLIKRLTQEQLSELAGITTDYLSEIERGKKCPRVDVLDSLAAALDIDAQLLLDP